MIDLNRNNATHLLACVQAIGNSRKSYMMPCHIVKKMQDGRLKIRVYGERYWNDERKDKISIRYVDANRVRVRPSCVSVI